MSIVKADIEVLKVLRQELITFANRQAEAIQSAESEINQTISMLVEAEQRWRYEVQRRQAQVQQCLREAAYAAQVGGYVDCSPYRLALDEAEKHLSKVLNWKSRVQETITQYRDAAYSYRSMLENEIPRATSFLADRILALEAYYASRVFGTAAAFAGAGNTSVMGGVIGAIRQSTGEISRVKGSLGEEVAAQVLSEKFGLQEIPFDQPKHGFDRVFHAPGIPLIVMESKVSGSGDLRLGNTLHGKQGSSDWIGSTASEMASPDSAQFSPANERIAHMIEELGSKNIPSLSVVVNPITRLSDVYTRLDTGSWEILKTGISLPDPGSSKRER